MPRPVLLAALTAVLSLAQAHTVIVYPGWRGDNLITNGTLPEDDAAALGINYVDGQYTFPYGMQWMYPCGGMPMSTNRSLWPVTGGAVSVQPGWFSGHKDAQFYINIGIQEAGQQAPPNMSHTVVSGLNIVGPTNEEYDGTFCIPQVPLPANVTFNVGDNVTIQVVELASHGGAIYNCADVTLANPEDVPEVNSSNCFNSSDLTFQYVYVSSPISAASSTWTSALVLPALVVGVALAVLGGEVLW